MEIHARDTASQLSATMTREDFDAWVSTLPEGVNHTMAVVDHGDGVRVVHEEFMAMQIVRAGDLEMGWRILLEPFKERISNYIFGTSYDQVANRSVTRVGPIYWRVRPEFSVAPLEIFTSYDHSAPDKCFITDKHGSVERGWVAIKAYARLARAPKKDLQHAA